ncbi:Hsp70 family protein [Actinoplanes sp. CA-030573]|uniref:Hsp70 family protein n=1 Tax=Actinoplanes sp. CA-030573 TaxID=3239898 RepID=UPI003D944BF4
MTYGLGVDLGTTWTAAAVRRGDAVEVLRLGSQRPEIPSLVFLPAEGPVLVGEPAGRRGEQQPERLAREFKRRVGDPVPLLVGGSPYPAHALLARQLAHVLAVAATNEQGPPESVVLTCPANWGPYKRDLLEQAGRLADAPRVELRTEPEAAAISYAAGEHMADGDLVAVYDLGGGTFDAAVLRRTAAGFELLGVPEGIEQLGGADFDEAVFDHVTRSLPPHCLTGDDPELRPALLRLRRDCVEAKEALSFDTDVMIPVALPGLHTRVRLTRREFEAMIAPALHETVGSLTRALRSAGVTPADLRAILMAGGSSRIPLAGSLVGTAFDRPVVVDPTPEHSIALGAARMTAPSVSAASPARMTASAAPSAPTGPSAAKVPAATAGPVAPSAPATPATVTSSPPSTSPPPPFSPMSSPSPSPSPSRPPSPPPPLSPSPPILPAPDLPPAASQPAPGRTEPVAAHPRRRTRILVAAAAVLAIAVSVPIAARLLRGPDRPAAAPAATTPACGFTDDFTGATLDPAWEQTRKDLRVTVGNGAAELDAPDGTDIYKTNTTAPKLLRPVTGDFVLEATVEASPSVFYQGAGLLLWNGPTSYLRIERGIGKPAGTIGFEYNNGQGHKWVHGPLDKPPITTTATRVVFRMSRTGGTLTGAWRPADRPTFTHLATVAMTLPPTVRVGVAALNRAQQGSKPAPFHARFDRVAVTC